MLNATPELSAEPSEEPAAATVLAEALAPRLAEELSSRIPRATISETATTARVLTLDELVAELPRAKRPAVYAERWLERRDPTRVGGSGRTRLSPSTFEGYRLNLHRHVLPRLGGRTLSSVRTEDVDRLIAELEAEGKAAGTVRNIVVPLRKMLADAVRQGLIVANPAARADLPPAQDFAGKEIPPEHTEAIRAALVDLAPTDPLRNEPDWFYVDFVDVALGSGLRLGELRALRWRDVARDRRLIRIERAYSRQELRRPKTESSVRSVPLFPSVDAAFRELAARAVERGRYAPDELIFASMRGGRRFSLRTSASESGSPHFDAPAWTMRATGSTTCGIPACRVSWRRAPM